MIQKLFKFVCLCIQFWLELVGEIPEDTTAHLCCICLAPLKPLPSMVTDLSHGLCPSCVKEEILRLELEELLPKIKPDSNFNLDRLSEILRVAKLLNRVKLIKIETAKLRERRYMKTIYKLLPEPPVLKEARVPKYF